MKSVIIPYFSGCLLYKNVFLWIGGLCSAALLVVSGGCSKAPRTNENKAFVAIIQTVPGVSSVDVSSAGTSVLGTNLLNYGETTGTQGAPYVEATAGVRLLSVKIGSQTVLQGNTAFQQGLHYSLFIYDSLKNDSLKLFILQDDLPVRTDTFTYVRFMNFSPGTYLNLLLTNQTDTFVTGFIPYAGNRLDPSFYPFRLVHLGHYGTRAFVDTTYNNSFLLDSISIDTLTTYTGFLEGTGDSLRFRNIRYN